MVSRRAPPRPSSCTPDRLTREASGPFTRRACTRRLGGAPRARPRRLAPAFTRMPPRHGDDGQDGHRRAVAALSFEGRQRDRSRLIALALVALGVREFAPPAPDNGTYAKLVHFRHRPCSRHAFHMRAAAPAPRTPKPARAAPGPSFKLVAAKDGVRSDGDDAHATFTKRSSYRSPVIRSPTPTADRFGFGRRLRHAAGPRIPARATPACQAACTARTATSTPPARPRRAPLLG